MSFLFPESSSHLCKVLCNDSLYANRRRRRERRERRGDEVEDEEEGSKEGKEKVQQQ